jgi:aerobic carbon-monoxide dehydrogenase medium subunit
MAMMEPAMHPAPIESLQCPTTIDEVLQQFAAAGDNDTLALAGGMSLMQAMKARLVRPDALVDLNGVAELHGITTGGDDLRIGAMTRYVDIASAQKLQDGAFAAIADAARHVGDRQVRNRGTIGGSLCWNYIAACTPVAALATGATLFLSSLDDARAVRTRAVAVDDFLIGPMETARERSELLRAVVLPGPTKRSGSAYRKWGLSAATLPVVGIGVRLWVDDQGHCKTARVAVGGLANGSQRLIAAEDALRGLSEASDDEIAALFLAASETVEVQSDAWATADYRRLLIQEIGKEVTLKAFQRAKRGAR